MSDEPTTIDETTDEGAGAPAATPTPRGRLHHPVWLVLIGVLASAAVFLIGGALMHHGGRGPGGFDGHRGGMMAGRADRGPGMHWGGPGGMRGDSGRGMMGERPGMFNGPGGAQSGADGVDHRAMMRDALASLGVTDAELATALTKQVDKLEKAKTITADQADAMRAHIKAQHAASTSTK